MLIVKENPSKALSLLIKCVGQETTRANADLCQKLDKPHREKVHTELTSSGIIDSIKGTPTHSRTAQQRARREHQEQFGCSF